MRKPLFLVLASLLSMGAAHAAKEGAVAKPRLGTFKGQMQPTITVGASDRIARPGSPETVNFKVRGQRLYVTMQGGAWRQSFKVTQDLTSPTGERLIRYTRDSGHGVGKRNEARLDAKEPDATVRYRGLEGSGAIMLQGAKVASWRNVGSARIQGTHQGQKVDMATTWDESFRGSR